MKKKVLVFIGLVILWPVFCFAETVRFAVITDTQGKPINEEVLSQAVRQILDISPKVEFVIVTGDLVRGSDWDPAVMDQFRQWREIVRPWYESDFLGLKVYPLPGNHDQLNRLFYRGFWENVFPELPDNGPEKEKKMTYSFDFGPCHFTLVNTSAPTPEGNHAVNLDWLAADLSGTDKPIKLVFGHEPAYPAERHVGESLDARPELRDQFWKILADQNVQAYFYGHLHAYDHWIKDNVHQICVGTTGADGGTHNFLVVEADENDVTVQVFQIETPQLYSEYKLSDTVNVPHEERLTPEPVTEPSTTGSLPCAGFLVVLIGMFRLNGLWLVSKSE